jgi:hypothetical protein
MLSYCFVAGSPADAVDASRLVGHTAGQVEMCSCSPCAMRLKRARIQSCQHCVLSLCSLQLCTTRKLTKRVRVLATNQCSSPSYPIRSDDLESSCIAVRPCQLLVKRRHQFPLMVDHFSFVANQYSRVPKTPKTCFRSLVEPDVRPDIVLRARLLQRTNLRTINVQALRSEAVEKRVVVYGS